jgi:Cytochrome c7 and related cytochrome c
MKKIFATIAALAIVGATTAMAAGPDTIELDQTGNKGKITFPHKKHQETLKISCKDCHTAGPGKIEGFKGMGAGHKLCKDCHSKNKPETASCTFCHKK